MIKRVILLLALATMVFAAGERNHNKKFVWMNTNSGGGPTDQLVTSQTIDLGDISAWNKVRGYVVLDTVFGESTGHGGGTGDSMLLVLRSVVGHDTLTIDSIKKDGPACTLDVNWVPTVNDTVIFGRLHLFWYVSDSTQGGTNDKQKLSLKWDLIFKE